MLTPLVVLLSLLAVACGSQQPSSLVNVVAPVGEIKGLVSDVDIDGRHYQVKKFLGIPYAEAPIGDRRFRKPIPKAHFAYPYNATFPREACYMAEFRAFGTKSIPMTEDCLILNIYVPVTSKMDLPVMVWIYGGGYILGTSNIYLGDNLSVLGEVIVVTVNYRLAVYGFYSTGDDNARGNYGLWDQHLAIRWVHDNIGEFGGNKNSVTLFGESAGSASVVYQALYPGNKGLFQRAIGQSGSPLGIVNTRDISARFSRLTGCLQPDWPGRLRCLRQKAIAKLNQTLNDPRFGLGLAGWGPVVDGEFVLEDPRLMLGDGTQSSKAREMFHSVDFMIGINSFDGGVSLLTLMVQLGITDQEKLTLSRPAYERSFIPQALEGFFTTSNVSDILRQWTVYEYTDWQNPDDDHTRLKRLTDMDTDYSFLVPAVIAANAHSRNTTKNTFFYEFSTASPVKLVAQPSFLDASDKANHGDEIAFVFGFEPQMNQFFVQDRNRPLTDELRNVSRAVMTMWTNLAKTGDPNKPRDIQQYTHTAWPKYDSQTQKYFEITPNMGPGSVKERLRAKYVEFWTDFLPTLRQGLVCPTPVPTNVPVNIIG